MRSTTWITVLVGLFMFQSLWNVAAAFCVHEERPQTVQSYHFGHHQNTLCSSEPHQDTHSIASASEHAKTLDVGEDHQDHLPSMAHLILEDQHFFIQKQHLIVDDCPNFHWKNSYQAPDLLISNPPPEFSPLMVG